MKISSLILLAILTLPSTIVAGELHQAVFSQKLNVISKLIDKGANINEVNENGIWPLLLACTYGHSDVVKLLIEKGVNVNYANSAGYTALHEAAGLGYADIVELLVNAGADIHKRDVSNFNALNYAQMSDSTKAIRILKRHGAKE